MSSQKQMLHPVFFFWHYIPIVVAMAALGITSNAVAVGIVFHNHNSINRIEGDGSDQTTLHSGTFRRMIADTTNRRLIWSEKHEIISTDFDGSNHQVNYRSSSIRAPHGLAISEEKIYFVEVISDHHPEELRFKRMPAFGTGNLDTLFTVPLEVNALSTQHFPDLAIDSKNEKIYWSTHSAVTSDGAIFRANFDGTQQETVVADLFRGPQFGFELDLIHDKIYWTKTHSDLDLTLVQRSDLNGQNIEDIFSSTGSDDQNSDIVLDVAGGMMYWNNLGPTANIQRATLNGENIEDLGIWTDSNLAFLVPEPSPLLLATIGIIGLFFYDWRGKKVG